MSGNESDLALKLNALRHLWRNKKIDDRTYTDSIMRLIGVLK